VAEVRGCTARAYVIRILSCWEVREADIRVRVSSLVFRVVWALGKLGLG